MTDSAAVAQRQQAPPQGVIAGILTLPLRCFGMLCGSLLLSILIECVGMHWFWPKQQWHHAEGLLNYELAQLSSYFTQSVIVRDPGRTANQLVQSTYETIFVESGVLDWVHETSARARASAQHSRGFKFYLGLIYAHLEVYVIATAYTVLTVLVRVLVLGLTLPLYLTAAFVGLVDGLVRRDIRRFGAGRESGFVYHRARASIVPLAVLPWVAYLALPVSVHPLFILLPCAVFLSIAVNITTGAFKKYL
jgi:integrating conjugative element membrane protein (TIGR03747 family)